MQQSFLLADQPSFHRFPKTRYQGSKRKLLSWISNVVREIDFDSCLDLFSGTASVSYLFKTMGKSVTSNDKLRSGCVVARALVVNSSTVLPVSIARELFAARPGVAYKSHIADTFDGIFYPHDENVWLDIVTQNIAMMEDVSGRDLALFCLFQACLAKRPYNLFHRANLYMRTSDVQRSFGNKTTWERPFESHFMNVLAEANRAVFDNNRCHKVINSDFLEVGGTFDLVYMDPPYLNAKGTGVDYLDFYHFLEGLTEYNEWPKKVSVKYKHRPYHRDSDNPWKTSKTITRAFSDAIDQYRDSIIVISYRNNGTPSVEEIQRLLTHHGRRTTIHQRDHNYVLSTRKSTELLFVSHPGDRLRS